MELDFYRINRSGRQEKYYNIRLRDALLSTINHLLTENNLDTETITVSYECMLSRYPIANTEFSHLILPDNYDCPFIPRQKTEGNNGPKTLNSKVTDRLLVAGDIYSGNIEGPRETQASWEKMHLLVMIELRVTKGYPSLILQQLLKLFWGE